MRAFHIAFAGAPAQLAEIETPRPEPGQIRLRIAACGLNFADLLMEKGTYQDTPEAPFTLGMEVAGEVVETGPVAEVFARPKHPYTAALIASVPEGAADQLRAIPGSVPPPHDMPPGCRFAPRCDHALPQCTSRVPETSHPEASRSSRCIRWKEVC